MDKTNRVIKICRRLDEIDFILSTREGRTKTELDELRFEYDRLEEELSQIECAGWGN